MKVLKFNSKDLNKSPSTIVNTNDYLDLSDFQYNLNLQKSLIISDSILKDQKIFNFYSKPFSLGISSSPIKDIFLLFGSETTGLPKAILTKLKNRSIKIPMINESRSLNLSNSVAIVVYEVWRQLKFSSADL